jgi:hypothetical protein
LLSPYGLIGFCGVDSDIGICSGIPYVAHVEEKTIYLTQYFTIPSNKFNHQAILFSKYFHGFSILSHTYAYAAK